MKQIIETTAGNADTKKETIINQLTGPSAIAPHCQNVDVLDFN